MPDHPTLVSVPAQSAATAFDILVLPGGGPGAKTFCASEAVLQLVHDFRREGKWVGAICAGTTALVAAGEKFGADKVRVTSHPSVEGAIRDKGWEYGESGERVVVDGKVVTSRG